MARRVALVLALLLAALPHPTLAENLQRLTVTSFTLSASTTHPHMEVPFDLVVRLHVRERLDAIDNLNLPLLSDLEVVGDERRYESGPSGTDYVEVVRVVAHHGGRIDVASATLDAIDALDGKPKRYSTNELHLDVSGPALTGGAQNAVSSALWGLLRAVLIAGLIVVALIVAVIVLVVRASSRRRRPAVAPVVPVVVEPPPRPPSARDVVRSAAAELAANPTHDGATRARARVRAFVGAGERETLRDVLARANVTPELAAILRALERAAFTSGSDLSAAIDDALAVMERL